MRNERKDRHKKKSTKTMPICKILFEIDEKENVKFCFLFKYCIKRK